MGSGAWKNARDSSGLTPHDYACLWGHYSYIHLVERKMKKAEERSSSGSGNGQIAVHIPQTTGGDASKPARLEMMIQCRQCKEKLAYGRRRGCVTIYRPAMVSMVAIAVVCVCAALLFKSSPEVLYSYRPFRWELLKYGSE